MFAIYRYNQRAFAVDHDHGILCLHRPNPHLDTKCETKQVCLSLSIFLILIECVLLIFLFIFIFIFVFIYVYFNNISLVDISSY